MQIGELMPIRICPKCHAEQEPRSKKCHNCPYDPRSSHTSAHDRWIWEDNDDEIQDSEPIKPRKNICIHCGYVHEKRTSKSKFDCFKCGQTYNPDGGPINYESYGKKKSLKKFDAIPSSRQQQIFRREKTAKSFIELNEKFLNEAEKHIEQMRITKELERKEEERLSRIADEQEEERLLEEAKKIEKELQLKKEEERRRRNVEEEENRQREANASKHDLKVTDKELNIIMETLENPSSVDKFILTKINNDMTTKLMKSKHCGDFIKVLEVIYKREDVWPNLKTRFKNGTNFDGDSS